ncbi:MAG: tetratricopeptide repeat protein [Calditrichaeota bacterium]|nr:tetratricopeptide repeat protein [Calditrichota bacterium]
MKGKLYIITFLAIATVFISHFAIAQSKFNPDNIDQLPIKYVASDTTNSIDINSVKATILHHEQMIAKYPNQPFIPYLMFELAELYASKAQYDFRLKMKKYDEDIVKFEKGKIFAEPILPRVNLQKTIDLCYQLLEKYPNLPYKDKILYRLAISHLDEGNQEKAKDYLQKLVFETPESPRISEAHFRLGEYYFSKRQFRKAIDEYKRLLDRWDDPYFNYSLYKLGWSYYNINDFTSAISSFVYLISDISLLEKLNTKLLGKTKADVRNEAIEYIAHSLTEYRGPQSLEEILSRDDTQSYAVDVLLKMGEIYKQRNFYQDAIHVYQTLLNLYPFYPDAPSIQNEIIQCYEADLNEDQATEAKNVFVEKYGPDSEWLKKHQGTKVRENAVNMSEEMLYSLGAEFQSKAQKKNQASEYRKAIDKYEEYLKKFRTNKRASRVNFYLAECYYAIQEFDKAADEYYKVMTIYGENEFRETAAFNRILAYYEILSRQTASSDSITLYIEDFVGGGTESIIPIKVASETQFNLIRACNDFVRQQPQSEHLLDVLIKFAETLYNLDRWDLAVKLYKKTVDPKYRSSPYYGQCIKMVAQCYLKMGDYKKSEKWFNNLADAFPDSANFVKKSKKLVASAKFKHAENLKKQGKPTRAAVEFLRLAFSEKDEQIAKAAIFEAGGQFEQAEDIQKAVRAYERMLEEQPNVSFKDELLMKAALLYEKKQDWVHAADKYMRVVDECPTSQFASRALLAAANCYEQLELWFKAKNTYRQFVSRFPDANPDQIIEALYKIGEISYNQNDFSNALNEFQATIEKFQEFKRRRKSVEDYLPAKAQFLIGEINFGKYKQIKIAPPLDITMKRKTALLQTVLKNYVDAGKYQIAEWTTASLFKTGMTFEELAQAIESAPVPEEYRDQEKEVYLQAINKQVAAARQKALDIYKANLTNASRNNIQNEWVKKTKQRIEQLSLVLGMAKSSALSQQSNQKRIVPTNQIKRNDQ